MRLGCGFIIILPATHPGAVCIAEGHGDDWQSQMLHDWSLLAEQQLCFVAGTFSKHVKRTDMTVVVFLVVVVVVVGFDCGVANLICLVSQDLPCPCAALCLVALW